MKDATLVSSKLLEKEPKISSIDGLHEVYTFTNNCVEKLKDFAKLRKKSVPLPSCGVDIKSSQSSASKSKSESVSTASRNKRKYRVFSYTNRGKKRSIGKKHSLIDGSEGKEMVRSLFSGAIRKTISNKELRRDISWESVSSIQHDAKSDTPADTLKRAKGLDANARSYVVLPTYEKAFKRKPPSTSSISTSSNDSKSSGSATSESSKESC